MYLLLIKLLEKLSLLQLKLQELLANAEAIIDKGDTGADAGPSKENRRLRSLSMEQVSTEVEEVFNRFENTVADLHQTWKPLVNFSKTSSFPCYSFLVSFNYF